jgi:hypothetical protein
VYFSGRIIQRIYWIFPAGVCERRKGLKKWVLPARLPGQVVPGVQGGRKEFVVKDIANECSSGLPSHPVCFNIFTAMLSGFVVTALIVENSVWLSWCRYSGETRDTATSRRPGLLSPSLSGLHPSLPLFTKSLRLLQTMRGSQWPEPAPQIVKPRKKFFVDLRRWAPMRSRLSRTFGSTAMSPWR